MSRLNRARLLALPTSEPPEPAVAGRSRRVDPAAVESSLGGSCLKCHSMAAARCADRAMGMRLA